MVDIIIKTLTKITMFRKFGKNVRKIIIIIIISQKERDLLENQERK